jgi:site-specific DNA-methyltransferase (adenine-specific)
MSGLSQQNPPDVAKLQLQPALNLEPAANKLFYGDNLDILSRRIPTGTVDLCYIDPPFNSKRNYFQIYNNQGSDDLAQAQAFTDTWSWGDEAAEGYAAIMDVANLNTEKFTEQTVNLIRGLREVLKDGALMAYLVHMTLRIVEIHRVLKPTGTFYLHCDPTSSHYLKLILDSVFCPQGGEFLNEIVWNYETGGASKSHYSRKHDIILFYSKSVKYTFNSDAVREARTEKSIARAQNPAGARISATDTTKLPTDVFRIQALNPMATERLGYPTQKPEALLERIIMASSNEGDVVLDAYCGCGTTVAVAQRLNRRWIGIDITYQSISLILKRLHDQYLLTWTAVEKSIYVDGVPRDKASAIALANRKDDKTRKEFEKWAILFYSNNQARINGKKGADKGVDGLAFFMLDYQTTGKSIFQVKSGGANRATIATLNSDMQREDAKIGILITMDKPTREMLVEVRAAGKFSHPLLNREYDRIQIVTIDEILAGARLNLPLARVDAVKSAAALPHNQLTLL